MKTKAIRAKTEQVGEKINTNIFESKFLSLSIGQKTLSELNQSDQDLSSPAIPLNSITYPKQGKQPKHQKLLNYESALTKIVNNKVINCTPEKPKITPKKKVGATRNISRGDINHMVDGRRKGFCITQVGERLNFRMMLRGFLRNKTS